MPLVSLIVPARDVAEYVGALLEDLRRQSLRDVEVLVVDDGSADRTPEIIAGVADADPRFTHLSSGGAGVSVARNLGIERATGEFLAFVDADDRVSPEYLRTLYDSACATGSDLVSCNADRLDGFRTTPSMLQRRACAKPAQRTHISRSPQLVWDSTVWNKLWRRSMWDRAAITYAEGRWLNDLVPSIQGHVASRHVDIVSDVLYYWRVRADPATSINDSRLTDSAARLKSLEDRVYAIRHARQILATLPGRAAVTAFDQRILEHDLPIYLPYYDCADDSYRERMVVAVKGLLEEFDIEPARFPLGLLLQEVYRAIRADDTERLGIALSADTQVAPSPTRRQHLELRLPGAVAMREPARRAPHGLLSWSLRRLLRQGDLPPAANAAAIIDEVGVDETTLTVSGAVRMWEGRSYVFSDWSVAARLDSTPGILRALRAAFPDRLGKLLRDRLPGMTRVTGPFTPVARPPDHELHPLVRSGWLPFAASIDLGATRRHQRVHRWRLVIELWGGRMRLPAAATLADYVSMPARVAVADGMELILGVDHAGELHLTPLLTGESRASVAPDAGARHLDLRWVSAGKLPPEVVIGGLGDPASGTTVELRCRWVDAVVSAALEPVQDGWRAVIDTSSLRSGEEAAGQRWSIWVVDDGGRQSLRVAPPERHRFPLSATTGRGTVFLTLDREHRPMLSMSAPDARVDLWPHLARVRRSGGRAAR